MKNKYYTIAKNNFPTFVKWTLIGIYLIFLAGAVVRMTGSGMGCPDWPKCFGYIIPPTTEAEITWQPNSDYQKGMIIVKDEALFVAENDLKTTQNFQKSNWKIYTKHNYAKFNKFHTWTEYINRLTAALAGIPLLLMLFFSFAFWQKQLKIPLLSIAVFLLFLFEAWLGKTVVDTHLKPTRITLHMVAGLVIVALLLQLFFVVSKRKINLKKNKIFNKLLVISILFSIIQIAMGTQVRQFIDEQVKLFGFENKNYSLMNPNLNFYVHRSFTIAIVLVNFGLFYLNQIKKLGYKLINWILVLIFLETITGILMYYATFPIGTQAIHLLAGSVLFGLQFYVWLQRKG